MPSQRELKTIIAGLEEVLGTSQKRLDGMVREWQKILHLQDWRIKISMKRESCMRIQEADGLNHYHLALKTSSIEIRDPIDDEPDNDYPLDIEATIVHELIHLHFAPFCIRRGLANALQEQAVEVLAQSLVTLKRHNDTLTAEAKTTKNKKGRAKLSRG